MMEELAQPGHAPGFGLAGGGAPGFHGRSDVGRDLPRFTLPIDTVVAAISRCLVSSASWRQPGTVTCRRCSGAPGRNTRVVSAAHQAQRAVGMVGSLIWECLLVCGAVANSLLAAPRRAAAETRAGGDQGAPSRPARGVRAGASEQRKRSWSRAAAWRSPTRRRLAVASQRQRRARDSPEEARRTACRPFQPPLRATQTAPLQPAPQQAGWPAAAN
jgi:hypothetical protein